VVMLNFVRYWSGQSSEQQRRHEFDRRRLVHSLRRMQTQPLFDAGSAVSRLGRPGVAGCGAGKAAAAAAASAFARFGLM
jgi:hypothetical protein